MLDRLEKLDELLAEIPRAADEDVDVVYVVQAVDGGPVKIGHSTREGVERRLKELQCGTPRLLVIRALYSGGMWLEQALHTFFESSRLRGEWFSVTPELVVFCPEVNVGG